jgi:WD40 repeat protein
MDDLFHPSKISTAHFSPDARRIATVDRDSQIRLWRIAGADDGPQTIKMAPGEVLDVHFDPNGHRIVVPVTSGAFEPMATHVFDVETLQECLPPLAHSDGVVEAYFSSDGKRIATAGEDYARVWDAGTGAPLTPALHHRNQVWEIGFSHDGRMIVTAGHDGMARVWDAATGEPVTPPLPFGNSPISLSIDDGARYLATVNHAGEAVLWDLGHSESTLEDLLQWARLLSCRQLDSTGTALEPLSRERLMTLWSEHRGRSLSDLITPPSHEIIQQPRSEVATAGGEVEFTVVVKPETPAHFQWRHGSVDIPGATNRSLRLSNISMPDFGSYSVEIRGDTATTRPLVSNPAGLLLRQH